MDLSQSRKNAFEADSIKVPDNGIALDSDFLDRVADDTDKGILMVEGIKASTKPLILEIWQGDDLVAETKLQLSFSGVEDMCRWVNLRGVVGGDVDRATDTSEPGRCGNEGHRKC